MKKNYKGQAAMEYLMTYGWAILVLVIVIAALYYFLPQTQETCLFQQNFACDGPAQVYVDDDGHLHAAVKLSNKLGQTAENVEVLCTNAGTGDISEDFFAQADGDESPQVVNVMGPGSTEAVQDIPCVDTDGDPLLSNEGAGFKGILAIRYNLDTDVVDKKHTTTGTISAVVTK